VERGITNVIEINMHNLARWVDGVFDNNLLLGTNAVSSNVAAPDGYTIYISDRRGDDVKSMTVNGTTFNATNGMVDNEDIYGPNGALDAGEDVQQKNSLVKDTNELPDPAVLTTVAPGYGTDINKRAVAVNDWVNLDATGVNHKMFRNAVRLFNGENLWISGGAGKLSATKGLTIATENMVYIWGNYNTTGINANPPDGTASLNDTSNGYFYLATKCRRQLSPTRSSRCPRLSLTARRRCTRTTSARGRPIDLLIMRSRLRSGQRLSPATTSRHWQPARRRQRRCGESRLSVVCTTSRVPRRLVGTLELRRVTDPALPFDAGRGSLQRRQFDLRTTDPQLGLRHYLYGSD
jgi:hypothetical protein